MKQTVASFLCVASVLCGSAFAVPRIQNCDFGWQFIQQDVPGAEKPDFDDSPWRRVDVPHDWSIEGTYSADHPGVGPQVSYLPTGIGWYRKILDVPAEWIGRCVEIELDGVFMDSTVWLNGHRVGGRPYGFLGFWCDLTPHLKRGRNVLAVRVDNSHQPAARWYTGSGIYGHVNLTVCEPLHAAHGGTFVRTPEVSETSATVAVTTELRNDGPSAAKVKAVAVVLDPNGAQVAQVENEIAVPPKQTFSLDQKTAIARPKLWSPESPALYTLATRLFCDGRLVDEVRTSFGVRSLRWDADKGFLLNGRAVKLKGMSQHHDGGPVGAAMPDALIERRLKMLKEMGCNAVRTAHNPRTPVFYDLCDRLGLLVMDEIFDGWHKKADEDYGARFFADWWRRDTADWIRRDRNHPSVILWSIGNETGERDEHGIAALIHTLDTTRAVTGGDVRTGVDVSGFNGRSGGKAGAMERFHAQDPRQPLLLSEEPHTFQTRGFYRVMTDMFSPQYPMPDYGPREIFSGGHSAYRSSYDNCGRRMSARTSWKRTAGWPWCAGEFRWTDFDYLGEAAWAGTESLAREFNFGVIDLAGLPKDHYYLYQSLWTTKPMVHLLPHWTHAGLEGTIIPVVAYSNGDEVEVSLNGKSLGRRKPEPLGDFVWHVPYAPGQLKAVAYRGGAPVAETVQRTAGSPQRIHLQADNTALKPDRRDISLVTFRVSDKDGVVVPAAHDRIDFKVTGPVRLLGYENGDPVDLTPHRVVWRRVFAGMGRGFFQATDQDGPVEVTAAGILGESRFRESTTVAIAVGRVMLRGELPEASFAIHYTTDGTPPTPQSPRYTDPFKLDHAATIRALVLRDGQPLLTTEAQFTQGEPVSPPAPPKEVKDKKKGGKKPGKDKKKQTAAESFE